MPYDPVEVVPRCLGTLDYQEGLGYLGDFWLVSLFSFLDHFSLPLIVLDHRVPRDVGSSDALFGGLIVLYRFKSGEDSLLGLCSEDKRWCWDCCPGCYV